MKHSEQLREKAAQEENDIKAMAIHADAERAKRTEHFMQIVLPKLNDRGIIAQYDGDRSCFNIRHPDGRSFDFYPKANKIHLRAKNKWIANGTTFIESNLLK